MSKKSAPQRTLRTSDPFCPVLGVERQLYLLHVMDGAWVNDDQGKEREQRRLEQIEALETFILNSMSLSDRGAILQVAIAATELQLAIDTVGAERELIARALAGLREALRHFIPHVSRGKDDDEFNYLLALEKPSETFRRDQGFYAPLTGPITPSDIKGE